MYFKEKDLRQSHLDEMYFNRSGLVKRRYKREEMWTIEEFDRPPRNALGCTSAIDVLATSFV